MNPLPPIPPDFLTRLLAVLVALFGASARCVARVAGLRGRARERFVRVAARFAARGQPIAFWGEDDATVDARIARMAWIARDPHKAVVRLSRCATGLLRARLGACAAPLSFAPPVLACAALAAAPVVMCADDTS